MSILDLTKPSSEPPTRLKYELVTRLAQLCQQREIQEANPTLASFVLTADPRDKAVGGAATPEQLAVAEIVAGVAREDPALRKLAADVALEAAQRLAPRVNDPDAPADAEELERARLCILHAIDLDPRASHHAFAARILRALRRYDSALEHTKLALQKEPANPDLLSLAGMCAAGAGHAQESERYWMRAVEVAPHLAGIAEGLAAARRAKHLAEQVDAEAALWPSPEEMRPRIARAYDGDRAAMTALARGYEERGPESEENFVMAYMWYDILTRYGDRAAKEKLRNEPMLWRVKTQGRERVRRWMLAQRD